jgi:hypothetical protein
MAKATASAPGLKLKNPQAIALSMQVCCKEHTSYAWHIFGIFKACMLLIYLDLLCTRRNESGSKPMKERKELRQQNEDLQL